MSSSAAETRITQKHVSGPGDVLPLGRFTTCKKKNKLTREKKQTLCFQTALEPSPLDN